MARYRIATLVKPYRETHKKMGRIWRESWKKLLQEEKSETPKPKLWSGIFSVAREAQSL